MHELAPLVYDLAIILGLAGFVSVVFQRIKQPVVLGYLIAGLIVGPYTPPHALVNDIASIAVLSSLGVIFLMFSLGLEFSFHKLTRVGFTASVVGIIEVILMTMLGYSLGLALGWSKYDCLFLGAALSISSTTIIIKAIDELKLKTARFAELIFGILIVEDLVAILLLVALSTIVVTKNIFSWQMFYASLQLILVIGGWFLVGYFLMPPLFRRLATYISSETLTIISIALCLILVCIAATFHYSTALGAFIMGSILAETVLVKRIERLILPIRDIFAAVFFVSVGMLINPVIIFQNAWIILLIASVTIIGKIVITSMITLLTGQSLNTALRTGFGMAQIGEFSFIIVALGLSLNVTSEKLYPIIVAVSGMTTFTTPYLIRFSKTVVIWFEKILPKSTQDFLKSYAAWFYRAQMMSQKNLVFRTAFIRLTVNGLIVAIIFTLIHYLVINQTYFFLGKPLFANSLLLFTSLLLSSPFIWGMLFCFRGLKLPTYAKTNINPGLLTAWVITLAEILILSLFYFHSWLTIALFFIIPIIFFIFSFKYLEISYSWFEKQLMENIKGKEDDKTRYEELAPWDTHLVEIEVGERSHFVGKTLAKCQIRQKYGINIVAIAHGSRVIAAPRGHEKIFSHDKLIILGDDKHIDAFKKQVETIYPHVPVANFLDDFCLSALLLENNHPLIGKTIRQSQLRERVHGLVVGLERENKRILNPDPDMVLQADDLVLFVGEADKLIF